MTDSPWANPPDLPIEPRPKKVEHRRIVTHATCDAPFFAQEAEAISLILDEDNNHVTICVADEVPSGYIRLGCSCSPDRFIEGPLDELKEEVEKIHKRRGSIFPEIFNIKMG